MEQTFAPASGEQADGVSSTAGHLKSSWERGREAAGNATRTAAKSLNDLTETLEGYVKSRPKTVALGALGADLVLGFLTGTLMSRGCRTSS